MRNRTADGVCGQAMPYARLAQRGKRTLARGRARVCHGSTDAETSTVDCSCLLSSPNPAVDRAVCPCSPADQPVRPRARMAVGAGTVYTWPPCGAPPQATRGWRAGRGWCCGRWPARPHGCPPRREVQASLTAQPRRVIGRVWGSERWRLAQRLRHHGPAGQARARPPATSQPVRSRAARTWRGGRAEVNGRSA